MLRFGYWALATRWTLYSERLRKIRKALEGLFEQVLRLALKAGAMKLGQVAIHGSKVKANASEHKAMSYGHMKAKEQEFRPKYEGCSAKRTDRTR